MRQLAGTFPMLAMNAPYTESQSYAIPLGENCSQREMVIRVEVPDMWFSIEGEPPPPQRGQIYPRARVLPDQHASKSLLRTDGFSATGTR